ncbi:MAG: alpha/beta hydrolase [Spongiibacteraceae bacterium]
MSDTKTHSYNLMLDFSRATGQAATPAEHRTLWDSWSLANLTYPPVVRVADDICGVACEWISTPDLAESRPAIIFLHGGGFSSGSSTSHLPMIAHVAAATDCRVLAVNYRLSPEHRFPAQIEDAVAVYRGLLQRGTANTQLAMMGDSAGGGLVFSTLLQARNIGLPMPAAAVGIGPWVDLALTGATMVANAASDPLVIREQMRAGAEFFLDGVNPYLPLASPIYADLSGLPPTLIQVSSSEALLDDAVRLVGRAQQCGVLAQLKVWPDLVHGWHQCSAFLPEGQLALDEIRDFLNALNSWGHLSTS